ncbi:MAG: FAD/FMN-containing dehydrogenase [Candidatus Tokpelaia sp. JSC161]|jgi:FAD/FMN-containing dehydrogenase|nr:MAG: FAD/FMN-containing dehydrogenase [Candidatus Tokpelaia sp. JSC161]
MKSELIAKFVAIVGEKHVIRDKALLASYLVEPRELYNGCAFLVLRPSMISEVSAIMQLATATGTPIVPQGGNTGLVGGQQPDRTGKQVIVSLSRLNRIRSIDTVGKVALVEAGVVLKNLQKRVEEEGCLFPLSLSSEGTAQLGGILSSNAGGTSVLSYGNARELCLGIEVVLPDGRILEDLRRVKKDNSGYDLKNIFIGAEGTLGIITAAAVKLFPSPSSRAVAYAGIDSVIKALRLFQFFENSLGPMLTGFEVMSRLGLEFSLSYRDHSRDPFIETYPWYVLINIDSFYEHQTAKLVIEDLLSEALDKGFVCNAVVAESKMQEEAFWQLRDNISLAQKLVGASIKHDISVPLSEIPDFLREAEQIVGDLLPGAQIVVFGHLGDGNLHYNISQPAVLDKKVFLARREEVNHRIHSLSMAYGGAFSAEHGIGQMKRCELLCFKSSVAIELMRGLKKLYDPLNIMNPGKIF